MQLNTKPANNYMQVRLDHLNQLNNLINLYDDMWNSLFIKDGSKTGCFLVNQQGAVKTFEERDKLLYDLNVLHTAIMRGLKASIPYDSTGKIVNHSTFTSYPVSERYAAMLFNLTQGFLYKENIEVSGELKRAVFAMASFIRHKIGTAHCKPINPSIL